MGSSNSVMHHKLDSNPFPLVNRPFFLEPREFKTTAMLADMFTSLTEKPFCSVANGMKTVRMVLTFPLTLPWMTVAHFILWDFFLPSERCLGEQVSPFLFLLLTDMNPLTSACWEEGS